MVFSPIATATSRNALASVVLAVLLLMGEIGVFLVSAAQQEQQCGAADVRNGVCGLDRKQQKCGMYMAESTIKNAGWGVFTGVDRDVVDDESIAPFDLSIPFPDYDYQMGFDMKNRQYPEWLLKDYHWTSVMTQAMFDAKITLSITPGLGMLANSHSYLFNLRNDGCLFRGRQPRNVSDTGSFTHCQEHVFTPMTDLKAGDELFVEYGDDWFRDREEKLGGAIPLSDDYENVNEIVDRWEKLTKDSNSKLAKDVWEMLVVPAQTLMQPSMRAALPLTHEDALKTTKDPLGSASAINMPNRSRSVEYLQEHGICLDHIETKMSDWLPNQHGAFAARDLIKGQLIAPLPVVPISRKHVEISIADFDGGEVWWKGQQLLVNYCYGHKDSSLLLFPYSPGVNLLNHAGGNIKTKKNKPPPTPNVALRWSSLSNTKLLETPVDELLKSDKASGLLLELVALRFIDEGEELLLDYGPDFDINLQKHKENWEPPVHANDYKSSWDFEVDKEVHTIEEVGEYPPSYITVRCWVNVQELKDKDDDGWFEFVEAENLVLDETYPCTVVSAIYDDNGEKDSYRITIEKDERGGTVKDKLKITNVPWAAITFVENAYTGNQMLRETFRQEMHLPDDVFPSAWKDLKAPEGEKCGLYMAESAIPNAGMGMFTTRQFRTWDRIFSGDVVIQVEDYEENQHLRRVYHNVSEPEENWLLDSYYWNPQITHGVYEADIIASIVPGLGMLANSHPGLVNAEIQAPKLTIGLKRDTDPGAGAYSYYHDVHFYAPHEIEAGEEIFVKYGDSWFEDRTDLGMIPLEYDFVRADALINRFHHMTTNGSIKSSDLAKDVWGIVEKISSSRDRLAAALPKDVTEVAKVAKTGSAKYSTPGRVRSNEWLEANGRCLDNIRPDDSTVSQAGKGAFATRVIKKGATIAPIPVVQILRRDLEVYEENRDSRNKPVVKFLGHQLLMNYCFSHKDSSIMLFPYAPVTNYINHNFTSPNAKLQWSALSKNEWLDRTPEDLASEPHAGLVMELVALRDIQPDEEVFISYGNEWDQAWRDFVIDWHPAHHYDEQNYTQAAVFNKRVAWLRTEKELLKDPYPENVMTVCFVGNRQHPPIPSSVHDKIKQYKWLYHEGVFGDIEFSFPCEVIKRGGNVDLDDAYDRKDSIMPANVRYTAVVHQDEKGDAIFTNIPRQAIRFFDVPYSSDLFLRNVFRHEIHLPDNMVPKAWRDLPQKPKISEKSRKRSGISSLFF